MKTALLLLALAVLGGLAYIRLAPSDPARWNRPLPPDVAGRPAGTVFDAAGGAALRLAGPGAAEDVLARLDRIAGATPRARRLAGSPAEGRITWITRSAVFGFPDYTTAETLPDGAVGLFARQRFGRADFGVNAARLKDWLAQLAP